MVEGGVEIEPWAGGGGRAIVGEGLVLPDEFECIRQAVFWVKLCDVRGKWSAGGGAG